MPDGRDFAEFLWRDVAAQFAVITSERLSLIGLVQLHALDLRSRHVHLSFLIANEFHRMGWPLEAALLAVNYAFSMWDLRRVYVQTVASDIAHFASVGQKVMTEESRLSEHQDVGGSLDDLVRLTATREEFELGRERLLRAMSPPVRHRAAASAEAQMRAT